MLVEDRYFYKTCFDSFTEGICISNKEGVIIMNNASLEEIFGYEEGSLIGKNFEILIPEKYRKQHVDSFKSFFDNPRKLKKGFGNDLYGLKQSGEIISLEVGLGFIEYSNNIYAKAIITDISLRKIKEIEINELNLELQSDLNKQTSYLTEAFDKLKNTNKLLKKEIRKKIIAENIASDAFQKEKELNLLQTKFLSLASHEFKTPLSGILTSTSLIGRYNQELQSKNVEHHVKIIKKLVYQLNNNLDDFLFLEKTETNKVNYKISRFDFCHLIKGIIKTSSSVLKKGQILKLTGCEEELYIRQDKQILGIIFKNIIFNAIKYSSSSTIKIFVHSNNYLTVTIEDKGIGIPENDQKHIFDRFFRAKNAIHYQGTGIGLNIVKHHVEGLGGIISFESVENKGSSFTVKLPLNFELN